MSSLRLALKQSLQESGVSNPSSESRKKRRGDKHSYKKRRGMSGRRHRRDDSDDDEDRHSDGEVDGSSSDENEMVDFDDEESTSEEEGEFEDGDDDNEDEDEHEDDGAPRSSRKRHKKQRSKRHHRDSPDNDYDEDDEGDEDDDDQYSHDGSNSRQSTHRQEQGDSSSMKQHSAANTIQHKWKDNKKKKKKKNKDMGATSSPPGDPNRNTNSPSSNPDNSKAQVPHSNPTDAAIKSSLSGAAGPASNSKEANNPAATTAPFSTVVNATASGEASAPPRAVSPKALRKKHSEKQSDKETSGSSSKSKTVAPPETHVIHWHRQLSVPNVRHAICPGLRVKVRFATARAEGSKRKRKWFGGRVSAVSKEGSKIRIKYDDGTQEVTRFPDADVIIDDTLNGSHEANAETFIPKELPESNVGEEKPPQHSHHQQVRGAENAQNLEINQSKISVPDAMEQQSTNVQNKTLTPSTTVAGADTAAASIPSPVKRLSPSSIAAKVAAEQAAMRLPDNHLKEQEEQQRELQTEPTKHKQLNIEAQKEESGEQLKSDEGKNNASNEVTAKSDSGHPEVKAAFDQQHRVIAEAESQSQSLQSKSTVEPSATYVNTVDANDSVIKIKRKRPRAADHQSVSVSGENSSFDSSDPATAFSAGMVHSNEDAAAFPPKKKKKKLKLAVSAVAAAAAAAAAAEIPGLNVAEGGAIASQGKNSDAVTRSNRLEEADTKTQQEQGIGNVAQPATSLAQGNSVSGVSNAHSAENLESLSHEEPEAKMGLCASNDGDKEHQKKMEEMKISEKPDIRSGEDIGGERDISTSSKKASERRPSDSLSNSSATPLSEKRPSLVIRLSKKDESSKLKVDPVAPDTDPRATLSKGEEISSKKHDNSKTSTNESNSLSIPIVSEEKQTSEIMDTPSAAVVQEREPHYGKQGPDSLSQQQTRSPNAGKRLHIHIPAPKLEAAESTEAASPHSEKDNLDVGLQPGKEPAWDETEPVKKKTKDGVDHEDPVATQKQETAPNSEIAGVRTPRSPRPKKKRKRLEKSADPTDNATGKRRKGDDSEESFGKSPSSIRRRVELSGKDDTRTAAEALLAASGLTTPDLTGPGETEIREASGDANTELTPHHKAKQDSGAVRAGRRAARQANEKISTKPDQPSSEGLKKKKKKRKDGEHVEEHSASSEDDSQWVQCDKCGKWRIIPSIVVPQLPKQWYCADNVWDSKRASCEAPEQTAKQALKQKKKRKKLQARLIMAKNAEAAAAAAEQGEGHEEEKRSKDEKKIKEEKRLKEEKKVKEEKKIREEKRLKEEKKPKEEKKTKERAKSPRPRDDTDAKLKRASPDQMEEQPPVDSTQPIPQPPRSDKKAGASSLGKKGKQDSLDGLLAMEAAATSGSMEAKASRGRGRPRRTPKPDMPGKVPASSNPNAANTSKPSQADPNDNLEWVQCEKCEKWRKLPAHISADELPDVWYCSLNTWNPASASCEAPEDKADGLQDIGFNPGSGAGKLSYRNLIFGSTGRKGNRPISERTRAAESLFLAPNDDEDAPPTVMYANSSSFQSRSRNYAITDENENMTVLELMSHSNLWKELRSSSHLWNGNTNCIAKESTKPPMNPAYYTYDTLPVHVRQSVRELLLHLLAAADSFSSEEVIAASKKMSTVNVPDGWSEARLYFSTNVVVTALCQMLKEGIVKLQTIGIDWDIKDWNPRYRLAQRSGSSCAGDGTASEEGSRSDAEVHKASRCIKIAKPWKRAGAQLV